MSALAGRSSILVINDDDCTRDLLVKYLELSSYNVVAVANNTQALHTLKTQPIDLVVMDVVRFDTDESALYKAIRTVSDVPVIISTTPHQAFAREVEKTTEDPAFLTKPYRFPDLVRCISLILRAKEKMALVQQKGGKKHGRINQCSCTEDGTFSRAGTGSDAGCP